MTASHHSKSGARNNSMILSLFYHNLGFRENVINQGNQIARQQNQGSKWSIGIKTNIYCYQQDTFKKK